MRIVISKRGIGVSTKKYEKQMLSFMFYRCWDKEGWLENDHIN